jgi:hypothetical protein
MERSVIKFDNVAAWLPEESDDDIADIEYWLEELEYGEEPLSLDFADLDKLWERIVLLAGGALHTSLERELRLLLGEVSTLADELSADTDDVADLLPTAFRLHLQAQGRNPSGVWEAALLRDRLENAHRTIQGWAVLDPSAASAAFNTEVAAIARDCTSLANSTRSLPTRRMLSSTAALCAFRLGNTREAIAFTESFFELERQAQRESASLASVDELASVTFAGVSSYAAESDSAGVAEVMRRVRLLAEPAGGMLQSVFVMMWSKALLELDPAFAQMLAMQMLRNVQDETEIHSDDALAAAHALLAASAAAGDLEMMQALVDEWAPIALASDSGPGAQLWLDVMEMEALDEADDED